MPESVPPRSASPARVRRRRSRSQGRTSTRASWLSGNLSILQWVHFVPDYDTWFDKTWIKQWGERNDVNVTVDHIANTQLDARAASEVAAQSGHDIFQFLAPPAIYEDQVINHKDIVAR